MTARARALLAAWLLLSACVSPGEPSAAADEAAIREVIAALDRDLTGDSDAWSAHFADDADYTTWTGARHQGRAAIRAEHARLLRGLYQNTHQRYEIASLRFLRPDVAVVHLHASVAPRGEPFPPDPMALPVLVLTRESSRWRVAVFHNLLVPEAATRLLCGERQRGAPAESSGD
jgi:uncharacterized protein (TIGR02246 family)